MCCRWPKAIHNLRLSLLQSYNWSKIKPDFVPKINTMLGICLFVCFFSKAEYLITDQISTSLFKNWSRIEFIYEKFKSAVRLFSLSQITYLSK